MVQKNRKYDILFHIQLRNQVKGLENKSDISPAEDRKPFVVHGEDILAVDEYLAGSRDIQGAQHIKERTFAGTGFSDNGDKFALGDGKTDFLQRMHGSLAASVSLADRFYS